MENKTNAISDIVLSGENLKKFKQAIKIGFYKDFYKNGIINATQLEKLMQMQNQCYDKAA